MFQLLLFEGATWKNSRHFCMGRQATTKELPNCYEGNLS